MHEEATYRDLVRKIAEVSDTERGRRVTCIRLWLGALSHLTERQLRDEWPRRTHGTVAEGASLEVEVSSDPGDPRALGVVLKSLDVEPREGAPDALDGGRIDMDEGVR